MTQTPNKMCSILKIEMQHPSQRAFALFIRSRKGDGQKEGELLVETSEIRHFKHSVAQSIRSGSGQEGDREKGQAKEHGPTRECKWLHISSELFSSSML